MALNVKALKNVQKDLESKGGDNLFLESKSIGEETDFRILPPLPSMNGMYFVERTQWWIAGKPYVSNDTFGGIDIIQEEIDAARALAKDEADTDLEALIDAQKNGMPILSKETAYLVPGLLLECQFGDDDELKSCDIVDNAPKILVAKSTLLKAMNKVVTSRPYQNGTDDGITDRVKGSNLILSKTGKGIKTEYGAMGWTESLEMDIKYYKDTPDPIDILRKRKKSDDYLRSVIRNYLYGEEIIEDTKEVPEQAKKATSSRRAAPVGTDKKENAAPRRRRTDATTDEKPVKTATRGRSIADDAEQDLANLD